MYFISWKRRCIIFFFIIIYDIYNKGADFGQMIATQILRSFIENFSEVSFTGTLNVKTFSGFTSKLFDAIQNSIRSIVQNCKIKFFF